MRLQRFLSQAGIASRREAEKMILEGKITLNGKIVRELGTKVDPVSDQIHFQGKPVQPIQSYLYYLLYKPRRVMVTKKDPQQRKTVYQLIPNLHPSVNSVGRLDYDSEGLLLLTNDGEFAYHLTHPSSEIKKVYEIELDRLPTSEIVKKLEKGILLEGKKTAPAKIKLLSQKEKRVSVEIHEGKKRQVRKMFEWGSCIVKRLIRVRFGFLELGNLKPGEWRKLSSEEVRKFKGTF